MPNRRPFDHITNCKFKVEIEGVTVGAFTEVDGLESTVEVEEFADGDDIRTRKRPGRVNCSNLILRRGFINTDELWNWHKKVVEGKVERRSGSIIICDDTGAEIMRYNFFEAWPCRYRLGPLYSMDNEPLIEEIEVAVEFIEHG